MISINDAGKTATMGKATGLGPLDDLRSKFNTAVPNVARVYDVILGGKDNFAADRELADQIMELIPDSAESCRRNREFLGRVVAHLAGSGITQFLDIGSGLPTQSNVHEVAQSVNPDARVVYVDNDPVVTIHARALMEGKGVLVVDGDLRHPEEIITGAREFIDFSRPVAVLLFAIVHFLTDEQQPGSLLSVFRELMAPGSCMAISHITDDHVQPEVSRKAQDIYRRASAPAVPRSRGQVLRFFDGLTLLGPGLVDINAWPAQHVISPSADKDKHPPSPTLFYGGVGIKDLPRAQERPDDSRRVARA
jgi:S-adenosyl methyltransferase